MGRRGPAKTPSALTIARGNPGKRAINHDEPKFPPSELTPPKGLKGRGLEEWINLCPELVRSGVLTVGDRKCFETYCRTVDDENRYEKLIAKVEDEAANQLGYPQHLLRIRTQLKQYEDALGLTPSSRAGIKVKKPADAGDERRRRFFGIKGGQPVEGTA
jgi:P27 family predicted phage terminase small subunit